jgi:gluconolactonase
VGFPQFGGIPHISHFGEETISPYKYQYKVAIRHSKGFNSQMSQIQIVDTLDVAVLPVGSERGPEDPKWSSERSQLASTFITTTHDNVAAQPFAVYSKEFFDVVGDDPDLKLIAEETAFPFAHEAGIWIPSTREVFFTSNQFRPNDTAKHKIITISKIRIPESREAAREEYKWGIIKPSPDILGGNGGVNYNDGALFCQQGTGNIPPSLVYMDIQPPYKSKAILNNFHGRPFNAINDVVVYPLDGTIWFTDPDYGIIQGLRDEKLLPNQVYCFNPRNGSIRAVADGIRKPNGIAFSHDAKTCYITDTQTYSGTGVLVKDGAATIYAFDVVRSRGSSREDRPYVLMNKRLFAYADCGAPDGIKVDINENVYSGCQDGVQVWNSDGILIGKILVPGGVANFCFTDPGRLILFNETRIFEANIKAVGALVR